MPKKPLSKARRQVVQDEADAQIRDDARLVDEASTIDDRYRRSVDDDYYTAPMDLKGGFWKKMRAWISSCFD
jgi:hypothetical protein